MILISIVFLDRLADNFDNKYFQTLTCIITLSVLLLNSYATHRWLPYSYAFINPVAGLGGQRNWDLDYWGLSSREGISRLKDAEPKKVVVVMPDNSSSIPFGGESLVQLASSDSPFSLYVFIHWNHKIVEDLCKIDFNIERDGQILGMGGSCIKSFEK